MGGRCVACTGPGCGSMRWRRSARTAGVARTRSRSAAACSALSRADPVPSRSPADFDVALVRADNQGPLTLTGTNTWLLGRDPAWVIDPGPALPGHVAAVAAEVA